MVILPLRLTDIVLRRQGKQILGPLSLTIAGQGITILLGPNGAGKTSLLRAMHGLERLRSGSIDWAVPLAQARAAQAFVFQTPILMRRNARDCIAFPLQLAGQGRHAARAAADVMIARVGLTNRADLDCSDLSGGERQKMALARALITTPQVLFLDEPCANLDGAATAEIETILRDARASGTRIIMSTHNVGQARRLADDVLFIHRGRLHDSGTAPTFFDQPQTPETKGHLNGDLIP